jgi:hypothetical protein
MTRSPQLGVGAKRDYRVLTGPQEPQDEQIVRDIVRRKTSLVRFFACFGVCARMFVRAPVLAQEISGRACRKRTCTAMMIMKVFLITSFSLCDLLNRFDVKFVLHHQQIAC